jgi:hypothetical protein
MYWKSRIKLLSGLLLALTALVAVSASAAQAEWTMKLNGTSTLHLTVAGTLSLGEIKTKNHTIHCQSGVIGLALVELNANHEVANETVVGVLASCTEKRAPACTVSSPGAKPGEILFNGSGSMTSEGGAAVATLKGKEEKIATLVYSGAECALEKAEQSLSGSMKLPIFNSAVEASSHAVELNESKLFLGKEEAFLQGKESGGIPGELVGEGGSKYSIAFK